MVYKLHKCSTLPLSLTRRNATILAVNQVFLALRYYATRTAKKTAKTTTTTKETTVHVGKLQQVPHNWFGVIQCRVAYQFAAIQSKASWHLCIFNQVPGSRRATWRILPWRYIEACMHALIYVVFCLSLCLFDWIFSTPR